MARIPQRRTSRRRTGRTMGSGFDTTTTEGLVRLGQAKGFVAPEVKETQSAIQKAFRILNLGTAFTSGAVSGMIRDDESVFEGISRGIKENRSFSDVIREDLGFDPGNRVGKIAVATGGFIADVLFDPLTYLTFGVGTGTRALRIGGQTLSKKSGKLFRSSAKGVREFTDEAIEKQAAVFIKQGHPVQQARKLAAKKVGRPGSTINDLFQRTTSKTGLTDEAVEEFIKKGVDMNSILAIKNLGPKILDEGGIKFMGRTLVKSATLAKTPVGKASRRLGQTEIVQAIKNTLGRTFVADFAKNPKLVKILANAQRAKKKSLQAIVKANNDLFGKLTDDQASEFFNKVFDKKLQIVEAEDLSKLSDKQIIDLAKERDIIKKTSAIKKLPAKKLTKLQSSLRKSAKATQRKERLDFADPELQSIADRVFEGEQSLVAKLARDAGISEEDAIKFYIPSRFKDSLLVKDFAVGRAISSPRMGFREKFTGVVNDDLIRDPSLAFSLGQAEVAVARIKSNTFRAARKALGRTEESLLKAGKRVNKTTINVGPETYKKVTRKSTGGDISAWFREDVAKEMDNLFQVKDNVINDLGRVSGFDYVTGLFKSYVTSPFPGFHIRNITSNQFLNMTKVGVDVFNPVMQKRALDVVLGRNLDNVVRTKTGRMTTLGEIRQELISKSDVLDTGAFSKGEFFRADKPRVGKISKIQKFSPLSRENFLLEGGRNFGSASEAQAKILTTISSLIQGNSVSDGVKLAEEALFNYSKLTDFERTIMRRIIPFYTFARKNAELQIKMLATRPGLIAGQLKGLRSFGEAIGEPLTEDDEIGLPDYVLESLGIKAGVNKFGNSNFITGFGLPIEEFLQRFSGEKGIVWNAVQDTMARMNPIIKFPAERATGVDFFRGRPIVDITKGNSLKSFVKVMPEPVAKQFKELVNYREVEKTRFVNGKKVGTKIDVQVDPFALHIFRNLPTSRGLSTLGFITDEEQTGLQRALRFFTGVRGVAIDKEQQEFFNNLDRMRELEDWLINMGVLKRFESTFVPKK